MILPSGAWPANHHALPEYSATLITAFDNLTNTILEFAGNVFFGSRHSARFRRIFSAPEQYARSSKSFMSSYAASLSVMLNI